jgi:hypothetical protein
VLTLLFVILALGGALVALLFFIQPAPQPLLVVIRLDQYDPPLPPSPWGQQDREALRGTGLKELEAFTSQDRDVLLQAIHKLGQGQAKDQPLVVFLAAYATGSDNGGVVLLPADARLDDPSSLVPFQQVLDALNKGRCPVKKRLLLLDLAQPCAAPRAGLLTNDVPERLRPLLESAVRDDPDLQILTSCSPGQVSLSSEELRHTVFAHYVAQGLLGRADGCLPGHPPDHRVSVQELQSYVKTHVDRWAVHNRGARQTPVFFGSDADYDLRSAEALPEAELTALPREYPGFLLNAWAKRDGWWNDRGSRTPLALYHELERETLRAEERWRGGEDPAKLQAFLDPRVKRLLARQANEKVGGAAGEPRSLAQAIAAGQKAPSEPLADSVRDLRDLAISYVAANQPKVNDKDVANFAKAKERFLKKFENRPFDLAWTVYAVAAAEDAPRPEQLRCWYDLLQPEGQPPPVYNEARFLKSIAYPPWKVEKPADWPAAAVRDALHLTREAEQVEAGNPQLQPWLKDPYAAAVQKRRTAEELLFDPDPAKRAAAPPKLAEANALFQTLGKTLSDLNEAQRLRDEALVFLPGYAAYLESNASNDKEWEKAVRATRALDDLLARPAEGTMPPEMQGRLRDLGMTLSNNLKTLREPPDSGWFKQAIDESRPVATADAVKMSALLRLPGLTAPARLTLWNNYRAAAGRLHAEALKRENASEPLAPYEEAGPARDERQRAVLRARASLTLLELARAADADRDQVKQALDKATRPGADDAALLALGRALRQAWKRHDADRAKNDTN